MSERRNLRRDFGRFLVRSIAYMIFAILGIFAGVLAFSFMGIIALVYISETWGITGTEMQLAFLSILGMSFYLGIELAQDFTQQFTSQFSEEGDLIASMESIEPEEPNEESSPIEVLAIFIWIGGIVIISVFIGLTLIGSPWAVWAIPFALLYGVFEIVLASKEITGPVLILAISPLLAIYALTGITKTVKDLLPQRIYVRHIPKFLDYRLMRI